jgi:hypothetical protein
MHRRDCAAPRPRYSTAAGLRRPCLEPATSTYRHPHDARSRQEGEPTRGPARHSCSSSASASTASASGSSPAPIMHFR